LRAGEHCLTRLIELSLPLGLSCGIPLLGCAPFFFHPLFGVFSLGQPRPADVPHRLFAQRQAGVLAFPDQPVTGIRPVGRPSFSGDRRPGRSADRGAGSVHRQRGYLRSLPRVREAVGCPVLVYDSEADRRALLQVLQLQIGGGGSVLLSLGHHLHANGIEAKVSPEKEGDGSSLPPGDQLSLAVGADGIGPFQGAVRSALQVG